MFELNDNTFLLSAVFVICVFIAGIAFGLWLLPESKVRHWTELEGGQDYKVLAIISDREVWAVRKDGVGGKFVVEDIPLRVMKILEKWDIFEIIHGDGKFHFVVKYAPGYWKHERLDIKC